MKTKLIQPNLTTESIILASSLLEGVQVVLHRSFGLYTPFVVHTYNAETGGFSNGCYFGAHELEDAVKAYEMRCEKYHVSPYSVWAE